MAGEFTTIPTSYPGSKALDALLQSVPGLSPSLISNFVSNPAAAVAPFLAAAPTFEQVATAAGGLGPGSPFARSVSEGMATFTREMAPFFKALGVTDLVAGGLATGTPGGNIFDQQTIGKLAGPFASHLGLLETPHLSQLANKANQATNFIFGTLGGIVPGLIGLGASAALRPEQQVPTALLGGGANPFGGGAAIGGFGQNGGIGAFGQKDAAKEAFGGGDVLSPPPRDPIDILFDDPDFIDFIGGTNQEPRGTDFFGQPPPPPVGSLPPGVGPGDLDARGDSGGGMFGPPPSFDNGQFTSPWAWKGEN